MYENKTSLIVYCKNTETQLSEIQDNQLFILFIGPFLSGKNLHVASVHVKGRWSAWIFALA